MNKVTAEEYLALRALAEFERGLWARVPINERLKILRVYYAKDQLNLERLVKVWRDMGVPDE